MRKSDRLRLLEMQVVRLEMLVDMYLQSINNIMESQGMEKSSLDSGKWYIKKPSGDH